MSGVLSLLAFVAAGALVLVTVEAPPVGAPLRVAGGEVGP